MNILIMPQFTMYNEDSTLEFDSDSSKIVIYKTLQYLDVIAQSYAYEFQFKVFIVMPRAGSFLSHFSKPQSVLDFLIEINNDFKGLIVEYIYSYGIFTKSPILDRYNFNIEAWSDMLTKFIDVHCKLKEDESIIIMNNIPEISRNIRALINSNYFINGCENKEFIKNIKLISYYHIMDLPCNDYSLTKYWPDGNSYNYFNRLLDGFYSSDGAVFNSNSNLTMFYQYITATDNIRDTKTATTYYLNPDDAKLVATLNKLPKKPQYDIKTFIFANRITKSKYTNWEKLTEEFFANLDYCNSNNIRLFFTNPTNNKGLQIFKDFVANNLVGFSMEEKFVKDFECNCLIVNKTIYIAIDNLPKLLYLEIASRCYASISLFFIEYYGGIAHRECILAAQAVGNNIIPIQPFIGEFKEWYKIKNALLPPEFFKYCVIRNEKEIQFLRIMQLCSIQNKMDINLLNMSNEYFFRSFHSLIALINSI